MHSTPDNGPDKPQHPSGPEEWEHLRGAVRHQTVGMLEEIFVLLRILLQDAVILVAGFAVEFAFEHWMHSEAPAFRMALNISSGFFLLLYGVMVTVHFVRYLREQVETMKPGTPGVLNHAGALGAQGAAEASAAARATKLPAWSRRYVAVGIVAVVAVAIGVAAGFYLRPDGRAAGNAGSAGEPIGTLAVLALDNISGDPENEYLGDGISESLISSLSQLPNLEVKSRDSAFSFKGKQVQADVIGQQLGVRAVFKGQVKQIGDSIMVSAELIDTQTNNQIWGQQYLRKSADIFALQQEIARDISDKLRLKLTGADQAKLAKRGTESPEAYQAYIKGRFWLNTRTEEGLSKAIEFFQQAVSIDPTYALAHAGIGEAYTQYDGYGYASVESKLVQAKSAVQKALELDDSLAEAHGTAARVAFQERNLPQAEREFQRAIELNPAYAMAMSWYGDYIFRARGKLDQSLAQQKRAQQLDPLSAPITNQLARNLEGARRFDDAIVEIRKLLELNPNFAPARSTLSRVLCWKGLYEEAIAEGERAVALSEEETEALAVLGAVLARAGRKERAREILSELLKRQKQEYASHFSIAQVYASLGERDKAFEYLEKSNQARETAMYLSLKTSPIWDPLRDDPRFQDLLRRMNLE